jgi:xylan 1,4-beta-xylosidase
MKWSVLMKRLCVGAIAGIGSLAMGQNTPPTGSPAAEGASQADFPVTMTIDASQVKGDMKPFYRFFGADEPNYAYMKDGLKLLGDIGKLGPAQAYFRTHNLMTSGDGTPAFKWGSTNIYTEDANGNPIYDFTIVDRIFDAYLKNGVKPYAQIGFMPEALSTHPQPYQHHFVPGGSGPGNSIYTGWTYPPKSYDKWRELVFQWVKHCVDKYGKAEVEQWYWEVWNEPNIAYWKGTKEEFFKLHDYAIDGVKKALPTARVGGPDAAGSGGQWTRDFIDHCLHGTNLANGQVGSPLDFVSFHAKGAPSFVNGHVRTGIANQLRNIDDGFAIVASFPETKDKPIVIGESDPDGCAACTGPQLGYRNTTMYSSYTADSFGRELDIADRHGVNLEGALTWAFEFENQPIFAGFRAMATTGGINVPAFNVFRMLGKMSGKRVAVQSSGAIPLDQIMRNGVRGEKPDVSAMAALDGNKLFVFAWHYHDDDVPGAAADIALSLKNLPASAQKAQLVEYRIDHDHSNAFTAWQKMGSPKEPTPRQFADLERAGQLETMGDPQTVAISSGAAKVQINMPRQGVSLMVFTW